jgi:pSer/pThr/pTyr-binding forkhead associated (FHA) protein
MDSKKSMRHFYCRDTLWEVYENMASDFSVSVDYLINESMRYYAKNKGYEVSEKKKSRSPEDTQSVPFSIKNISNPPPLPGLQPSNASSSGSFNLEKDLYSTNNVKEQAPITLYLVFEDEKFSIDKEQFIIGRVNKLCDLTIKDSNISRKHSAVLKRNGVYFIKDLGSTNGIEYNGIRIDNKRIDEGDIFYICEHELRFTYK